MQTESYCSRCCNNLVLLFLVIIDKLSGGAGNTSIVSSSGVFDSAGASEDISKFVFSTFSVVISVDFPSPSCSNLFFRNISNLFLFRRIFDGGIDFFFDMLDCSGAMISNSILTSKEQPSILTRILEVPGRSSSIEDSARFACSLHCCSVQVEVFISHPVLCVLINVSL